MPFYEKTALRVMEWLEISYPENLVFGARRLQKQADGVSEAWVRQYRADKQKRENDNQTYSPFSITSWDFKTPNIP
ncbi:MAG: hypothetical protein OXI61_15315 [Candidatus Poribacteria bacterium]|nr:hypothetical protein [Candidatus Poribacteria bacterium]